ncbi:hypothetical protein [Pseudomonas sp.]|uniref:hypothetical protein n=1 Tax=Pseudomonas sp. TaxID=306 RepID=UPI003D6DFB9D
MLDMVRAHEALERRYAQEKEDQQHAPTLADNDVGSKIKMPEEDTHRTVQFDEPKKNPP